MRQYLERSATAIKFLGYPPLGKRSLGNGQYGAMWGADYRQIVNDNLMIVAMIESPAGVKIADEIASTRGVDVVFVASTDLASFSAYKQGDAPYEALVKSIEQSVNKTGKKLAGPLAWKFSRQGYSFFQGPSEASLIKTGVEFDLGGSPKSESRKGVAPTEETEM